MIRRSIGPVAVVLALVAGLSSDARRAMAQQPAEPQRSLFNSDQIPRELVVALLSRDAMSVPDILIGKVPPLLVSRLLIPEKARVLGSQMSASLTLVVIDVPIAGEALRPLVDTGLVQRGWRRGPTAFGSGGGFRPASSRTPFVYCSRGESVSFTIIPRTGDASLLRYAVMDDESQCGINFQHVAPMSYELPTLIDPPGTEQSNAACRAAPPSMTSGPATTTAFKSALSNDALLAAYGKQLTDSGWVAAPKPAGDRSVEARWRETRAGAGSRYVTVSVTQPAANPECRVIEMHVALDYSR
jgi:hypothetical protein